MMYLIKFKIILKNEKGISYARCNGERNRWFEMMRGGDVPRGRDKSGASADVSYTEVVFVGSSIKLSYLNDLKLKQTSNDIGVSSPS
jgi:hypothetical protein